jgi:histone deacetylase HOS3
VIVMLISYYSCTDGTQAIAWRINADTVRHDIEVEARRKALKQERERKGKKGPRKSAGAGGSIQQAEVKEEEATGQERRGLKIFYGSLHDIESFPCEDGNKELITDASMCIEGAHGQWIWNGEFDCDLTAAVMRSKVVGFSNPPFVYSK